MTAQLSYTRVRCYESCPLAYRLRYLDRVEAIRTPEMSFGTAIHEVLERLVREHISAGVVGPLCASRGTELWTEAWRGSELRGLDVFAQGLIILKDLVARQGMLDPSTVLAVEQPFELEVGALTIVGVIDRVDRLDAETIEIIDYKTSRALKTSEALEGDLQLALYRLAARKLWPWARTITASLEMLRQGARQTVSREPDDDAVERYLTALADALEADEVFEARLTAGCVRCSVRRGCDAYQSAARGDDVPVASTPSRLAEVARERASVSGRARVLFARRQELDALLLGHLEERDAPLEVDGVRYSVYPAAERRYPIEAVLDALSPFGDRDSLIRELRLDEGELDRLLEHVEPARARMVRATLELRAETTHRPRVWAQEVSR